MGPFTSFAGGYITNPAATVGCLYCPFRTTDQFMFTSFHVEYSHRWRNLGILMGVVVFNVRSFFDFLSNSLIQNRFYVGICDIHADIFIPYPEGKIVQATKIE